MKKGAIGLGLEWGTIIFVFVLIVIGFYLILILAPQSNYEATISSYTDDLSNDYLFINYQRSVINPGILEKSTLQIPQDLEVTGGDLITLYRESSQQKEEIKSLITQSSEEFKKESSKTIHAFIEETT